MAASQKKQKTAGKKEAAKAPAARTKTASAKNSRKPASRQKTVKQAARQPRQKKELSRTGQVLLIVLFWVLGLMALFSLGSAGRFLHNLCVLITGSFAPAAILLGMAAGIKEVFFSYRDWPKPRIIAGLLCLAVFWMMAGSLFEMPADDPFGPLANLAGELSGLFSGVIHSGGGLIGGFLAGGFAALFSKTGAWIFCILCAAGALLLSGWGHFHEWGQELRKWGSRLHSAAEGLQSSSEEQNRQPAEEPVIYNGGIQADFSDEPAEDNPPKKRRRLKERDDSGLHSVPLDAFDAGGEADVPDFIQPVNPADGTDAFDPIQPIAPEAENAGPTHGQAAPSRTSKRPESAQAADEAAAPVLKKDASVLQAPYGEAALAAYRMPPLSLLKSGDGSSRSALNTKLARTDGDKLIGLLNEFGVEARLGEIHIGPSVTKFEIVPGQGVRVNAIVNLQNDIKMALAATDIRIEAPIPGKSAVGIEVPNAEKTVVMMKDLMGSVPQRLAKLPLVFALGKDLLGTNVYGRLDTMPHLLIAGATGSGKSVCVNSIICSILMRTRPNEVKLLLVDPKKVEFTPYNGVPHLLSPVITDGDLAGKALKVIVEMMDRRYDRFEEAGVRNIASYNAWVNDNPQLSMAPMPRIVVIIDELADLMIAAPKDVEQSIQRITQLARAAGIHLIVATQRPSVNVITGVIKANIPSRIAFAVSSSTDSRTILDQAGAERLLGYGDMLFLDNGDTSPRRIQGVFIQDEEVSAIADYARKQAAPMYDDAFVTLRDLQNQGGPVQAENADPLYNDVKHYVISSGKASTSLIQRRFAIGYGRAARIMDMLEANGIVGPAQGTKPREILAGARAEEEIER